MLGLSIFEIAKKETEKSNSVGVGKYFLALIVIPLIIELSIGFCRCYIASKFAVNKNSKIYKFFTRISIILLFVPVFIFAQLPLIGFPNSLFENSDVLGYYGAIIGGGVTVFGVYWTLNYESKKSEEERRKNSLPILRFCLNHAGFSFNTLQQSKQVLVKDKDGIFFTNYDIFIDTTNGSREYSENSIHQYGNLKIQNIGLGTAIISDIKLTRTTPVKTEVKNIGILKLNQKSVFPKEGIELKMCIRSDDLNKEDTLYFTFVDLYSNKYLYKIPFNWLAEDIAYSKTRIRNEDVEMFPDLVPTEK